VGWHLVGVRLRGGRLIEAIQGVALLARPASFGNVVPSTARDASACSGLPSDPPYASTQLSPKGSTTREGLGKTRSPRERARVGNVSVTRSDRDREGEGRAAGAEGRSSWWWSRLDDHLVN
jgi:hypothetical protein